jgi:hypothetical protein
MHERLAELVFDVRHLDLASFRRWLDMQLARWASDRVFVQRSCIRDLRRGHPELLLLEAEQRRALAADVASPSGPRLRALERSLRNTDHALRGLADNLTRAKPVRKAALEAKHAAFLERRLRLRAEYSALANSSPERAALLRATNFLDQLRVAIGLDREEAHLASILTAKGRGSSQAGSAFEDEVLELTRTFVIPQVVTSLDGIVILRSVRLGAAGVELDQVVVRQSNKDEPVEVLAIVEAKRNINDLGHGFARRQTDLAWLTGDRGAYDPVEHRTGVFTIGHFDRPAAHWQDGHAFVFTPGSFRRFVRGREGFIIDGLYLVTRAGPIWGLSGAALSRVAASIGADERWSLHDTADLQRLFDWARSLAGPIETPEVLNLYTAYPKQLVTIEPEQSPCLQLPFRLP